MTEILRANATTIQKAWELLKNGEVVVIPTETVYGLWADATNDAAINKIFAAKGRPQDNPLIVHVDRKTSIDHYATVTYDLEKKLIEQLMPGPLTIILPKKDSISKAATAWLDSVGVRIPDHITAQQCIRASWTAIAAPSANISWKPSPTSASMAHRDMNNKVPLIINGGNCVWWIESTVVKVVSETEILILRPGMITKEDIKDIVGEDIIVQYSSKHQEQSPGTRYTHYAPSGKVQIINALHKKTIEELLSQGHNIWLIATKEFLSKHKNIINHFTNPQTPQDDKPATLQPITTFPWWSHLKLTECAQSLYNLYHKCDDLHMSIILIENLPEKGIGLAIMNRVKKSTKE